MNGSRVAALIGVLTILWGCEVGHGQRRFAQRLSVEVRSDSASIGHLVIGRAARARVWMEETRSSRLPRARPAPPRESLADLPGPQALPDFVPPEQPTPSGKDATLKPPVLKHAPALVVPSGARSGAVELEVSVSETGEVTSAAWSGGVADSALIGAARRCALGMRFYPALRGGRAVEVSCRQRFEFGAR